MGGRLTADSTDFIRQRRARPRARAPEPMQTPYDLIAEEWHASPRAFTARKYLGPLLDGLARGSRVLDLGCGTGEPVARHIVERGFGVVGVDESEAMLAVARRVVPEAELIRCDMRGLTLPGGFAAAIAWDSIFHVERASHREIFRKLHGLLVPGGRLLLSAGGSGHEGFTSEMYGRSFFYSGHEPPETLRLLRGVGFEIELCEEDDASSRGHVAIVARREGAAGRP